MTHLRENLRLLIQWTPEVNIKLAQVSPELQEQAMQVRGTLWRMKFNRNYKPCFRPRKTENELGKLSIGDIAFLRDNQQLLKSNMRDGLDPVRILRFRHTLESAINFEMPQRRVR